jgi:glutamate racemase
MIGVFDSGYGGLTILKQLRETLPEYDFIYLGDNARAPYGSRSFDVVYEFTRQSVMKLFSMGCHLVILACNTASAKALRTIQQHDLKQTSPFDDSGLTLEEEGYRVLGVIRPTTEIIGNLTHTRHVGIVATEGTIRSESYNMEITKLFPDIKVSGQACPLWAAIVEAGEADSEGAEYFVRKRIGQLLAKDADIDTIILGCTHYPLLMKALKKAVPSGINLVSQGDWVAASLKNYLQRHPETDARCSKGGMIRYYTTESEERFKEIAAKFLNEDLDVQRINII